MRAQQEAPARSNWRCQRWTVLFAGLVLFPALVILTSCDSPGSAEVTLTVTTHNIGDATQAGYRRVEAADIVGAYQSSGFADIYLLQEIYGERYLNQFHEQLEAASRQRYRAASNRRFGLAVLSVFPILDVEPFGPEASRWGNGVLRVRVQTPNGPLQVVSVHLDPILKKRDSAGFATFWFSLAGLAWDLIMPNRRSLAVAELRTWLRQYEDEPIVLGGDFNTVPLTAAIRRMGLKYRDALAGTGDYFAGTYWKISSPVKPRVDFIFHSRQITVSEAAVLPIRTGDHLPVTASISFPAP